jgi:hypothetical protein
LTSTSNCKRNTSRMPGTNTSNLQLKDQSVPQMNNESNTFVCLIVWLCVPFWDLCEFCVEVFVFPNVSSLLQNLVLLIRQLHQSFRSLQRLRTLQQIFQRDCKRSPLSEQLFLRWLEFPWCELSFDEDSIYWFECEQWHELQYSTSWYVQVHG